MRDRILKIRVLISYLHGIFVEWRETVWKVDPDALACCSARGAYGEVDCGCGGMTNRENWKYLL